MCGIGGFWGEFDKEGLNRMSVRIAHRGPDDKGLYVDKEERIGLAHRRLAIIDLSPAGHQPMWDPSNRVALVFNGEIYNFLELRRELEYQGVTFRGRSDTEVLLNLYMQEGEAMLTRLNGIFAFAIWDERKTALLLARDALGVKPLYYASTAAGVAFASEIKGLLALMPGNHEIDSAALHRYLTFLWCPGEGTPFKAIRKLSPGHAMVIREGRIDRLWNWYQLPPFRNIVPNLNEQAAVTGTLRHLREAVRRQMIADVPVGAFLSGGLDSSAVVALAREVNPNIQCFTIEAEGNEEEGFADDLPYARRVAKYLGVPLEIVHIDAKRMASDLEMMVEQLDEPLADSAPLNVLYICQLARRHGMKVLLSGAGGDDLFAGYRRHRAVQLDRYLKIVPQTVRKSLEALTDRLDRQRVWGRRLAKMFNGASLFGDHRLANYFTWARERDLVALYTAEFRAQIGDAKAAAPFLEFLAPLSESVVPLDRMLALEQRFFLADHNLIYTDKMSMAASVEVRVPFLDLDMVEFAGQIPARLKQRGRVGKWVLKRAMEPYLPRNIIYRPKSGFGAPIRRWIRNDLRPLLSDVLSKESLSRRGIFDHAAVNGLIAANNAGRIDASYTLFSLLCIEMWCRSFIDNERASTHALR